MITGNEKASEMTIRMKLAESAMSSIKRYSTHTDTAIVRESFAMADEMIRQYNIANSAKTFVDGDSTF